MTFRVLPLRFDFIAQGRIVFPEGKAGNVFRGALGMILPQVAPDHAHLFAPSGSHGPSGLADWPRPFVIRAAHLDGRRLEPGEEFSVGVNVFDLNFPAAACFAETFARIGQEGIGPGRGQASLRHSGGVPVAIDLAAPLPAHRLRVNFETPTELKAGGEVIREPVFQILFSRIRDRLSTLRKLYQDGPLPIGFREMADRAALVRLSLHQLKWETAERFSTRTRQTHPLGGMTGWAEYQGELSEFVPYLDAAAWTGVGRQTVWGKGVIRPQLLE